MALRDTWNRVVSALTAGRDAWRDTSGEITTVRLADQYDLRWALATGDALTTSLRRVLMRSYTRVYANTRIIYSHVPAVVDFYASCVYQGDLSTDGKPLPDGTEGAIPLDPQTGDQTTDDQLRVAIAELWKAWNWRDQMRLRPRYGAALGDVLTELIDDVERGIVYPSHIWPGYVTDLQLDSVGNVKSYRLDYRVTVYDEDGQNPDTFTYGKRVDKETFRYYRDDQPHDYGAGQVVSNPYGFVPAIWDRHIQGPGERGAPAAGATIPQLIQVNSLLSHALDFQTKGFAAPFLLTGVTLAPGTANVQTHDRPQSREDVAKLAESQDYLPAQPGGNIIEPKFDIGQTLPMFEQIKAGMLDLNPEVRFWQEMRAMSQVTGPVIERLTGDAGERLQAARAGYDTQTVKLQQMGVAMWGYRVNQSPPQGGWTKQTKSQLVFRPFDLDSYAAGLLDHGIKKRGVIAQTPIERVTLLQQQEALQTGWALGQVMDPEQAQKVLAEKRQAAELGAY